MPDLSAVSVVMVTHNRDGLCDALAGRFGELMSAGIQGVLVDNASREAVVAPRPWSVHRLTRNIGVGGFNVGVSKASGAFVLVLDDDAWVELAVVRNALRVMVENDDLDGVAFMPRCPRTRRSEWPFAERLEPRDRWPLLGCGMIIRRQRWNDVGGFEERFFLYTNDTDLALKMRASRRRGLWFDPSLWCWHDNATAIDRPVRWYHWATRNRVWLAKRHAGVFGRIALFFAAANDGIRRSRGRPSRLLALIRGLIEGSVRKAPPLRPEHRSGWEAFVDIHRVIRHQSVTPQHAEPPAPQPSGGGKNA